MSGKSLLCVCGFTKDGRRVLGGAFHFSDTLGLPLSFTMDLAERNNCVISLPHFFASAMEHGWDDQQTFAKISEALTDRGTGRDLGSVKLRCIFLFMRVAETLPGRPATEIGRRMRELLEG